jgi:hypothetical protein
MGLALVGIGGAVGAVIAHFIQGAYPANTLAASCATCAIAGAISVAGFGPLPAAFLCSGLLTALAPFVSMVDTEEAQNVRELRNQLLRNLRMVLVAGSLGTASAMFGFLVVVAIRLA